MSSDFDYGGGRIYAQSLVFSQHEIERMQQGQDEFVEYAKDRVRAQFAAELFKQIDDGRHHVIQIREEYGPPDRSFGFPAVEFIVRARVTEVEYVSPYSRTRMLLPQHNYGMYTNWALTGAAWGEAEALSRAALREMRRRIRGWFARLGRKIRGVAQR